MFTGTRRITPLLAAILLASCANTPEPPTNSHVGAHPYSAAELGRAFTNSRSALPRDLYGPLGIVIDARRGAIVISTAYELTTAAPDFSCAALRPLPPRDLATTVPLIDERDCQTIPAKYSKARPFIVTYDAATFPPSAMQEARGMLAVERGCVVLREANGSRLLVWRQPAQITQTQDGYRIEQLGASAAIGAPVALTGTGGNTVSPAFARQHAIPSDCRTFPTFAVNGILPGE